MIFAHAPFGWLVADWCRRVWKQDKFRQGQKWWLLIVGAVGGLFPDLDLFYYHLVSAEVSHRQLPTHSVFLYLPLVLVVLVLLRWFKKTWWFEVVACFGLGVLSHLLTDSIGGAVMWLWPFSQEVFGLSSIPLIAHSSQAERLFLYSFLTEGLWISVFIWIWMPRIVSRLSQLFWRSVSLVFLVSWWTGFILIFLHTTHLPAGLFFNDQDQDHILNLEDEDMDGDGEPNFLDVDADNDGVNNQTEVVMTAKSFEGVWVDPTNGGLIQILTRMGWVTNGSVVIRSFAPAGFFWRLEMTRDYQKNSHGYVNSPDSPEFDTTSENRRIYFVHQGRWFTGDNITLEQIQPSDIVFFAHGEPEGVVVGVDSQELQVLRAETGEGTRIERITSAELRRTIIGIGRSMFVIY